MKKAAGLTGALGLAAYFIGFGIAFLVRPELVEGFGLKWLNPAGMAEVRVYYGAFSVAAGLFTLFLTIKGFVYFSLAGGLFFSGSVLFFRLIFTTLEGAWGESYTLLAIPAESLFVLALFGCFLMERSRLRAIGGVYSEPAGYRLNRILDRVPGDRKLKILFICSSNVCRSPWCEYQFRRMVKANPSLAERVGEIRSSAVFNRSKVIHGMTRQALVADGFTEAEADAHVPSFIKDDISRYEEADLIIGMSRTHGLLLPGRLRARYLDLSRAGGQDYRRIEDPFLIKDAEKYGKVMQRLSLLLEGLAGAITARGGQND